MSWREVGREQQHGTWFVHWRCKVCGRRAVSGGHAPSRCVCQIFGGG